MVACVFEYSKMIRLRSSMVMNKMQWVTKKRKRSLTVALLYIHMYTQTSSIYVYARAVIQV